MYNDAVTRRNTVVSWADLHTIATTYLGSLGTEKWEHAVHRAFDKNVSHHTTHLLTLLQTPLSDNAKIRAACAVDFNVWFDPDIFAQLSPLLQRTAPEPAVRIYSLPWAKDEHIRDRSRNFCVMRRTVRESSTTITVTSALVLGPLTTTSCTSEVCSMR